MFAYGGFYKVIGGTVVSKTPMTLIAGLVGIEIDKKNRFMRPKIGWIVSESNHKNFAEKVTEGQELIASKIPEELKQIDYLPQICIQFINDFDIPEWLNTVKIDHIILRLYKKPTPKELKTKESLLRKDGSISNIKVKEDSNAHPEHYEEAKRIIMGMPKWKPAYIENKDGSKRYVRFKIKEIITVF